MCGDEQKPTLVILKAALSGWDYLEEVGKRGNCMCSEPELLSSDDLRETEAVESLGLKCNSRK